MQKYLSLTLRHYRKNSKKYLVVIYIAILLIGGFAVYKVFNSPRGKGISIVPTSPNAENPYYFIYELKPGDSLSDSASIVNPKKVDAYVYVSSLDTAEGSTDADFKMESRYAEQSAVGKWISVEESKREIEVAAGEIEEVNFTVTIPADLAKGEYWGAIAASEIVSQQNEGVDGEETSAVATETQVAARVKITVSDSPKIIEKYKVEKISFYWKYIISSVIITSAAIIMILLAQINPKKNKL